MTLFKDWERVLERSIQHQRILRAKNRGEKTKYISIDRLTPLVDEVENWKMQRDVTASIETSGLLEPLSVLPVDGKLRVDKGCNRLRAAQELGYTHIDCNVYETWDELFKASEIGRKRSRYWRDND